MPGEVAENALKLILGAEKADPMVRDDIVAGLLQRCLGARRYVAKQLQHSAAIIFETLFHVGDGAANGITVVSLDASAWSGETVRRRYEKDVFILFLAKLLESGHDNDGRALKGISRHLAVDAEGLHSQIDEQSFGAILNCLDYRLSDEVRGQATLATAKYLEVSKKTGEAYLTNFITDRTAKHSSDDLVSAFSVAAAVFPIATPLISALFLVEGFLPSLVPLLDKKSRPIKVEKAALDMLNAACIDGGCREAISKYCWDWMHHVMEDEADERHGQAALILAKVQSQPSDTKPSGASNARRSSKEIEDIVPRLKSMLLEGTEIDQRTGIEGLAYASIQPTVKEDLVKDPTLLERLFRLPKKDSVSSATAFGYLTMIDNLTRYLPVLSEEQRKMSELKAYANASKPQSRPHPLDENDCVTERCKKCLDARVVAFLVTLKNTSVTSPLPSTCLAITANILLSLAKTTSHRGTLAQQGAIPLLLQIHGTQGLDDKTKAASAHALARILISVDPSLIPSYTSACIRPLLSLIDNPLSSFASGDQPRDLLPIFESLLSLTNLASELSFQTGPGIVKAYAAIEDLLLHQNTLLQRAATELVCNLATTPDGLEKLADGSQGAARRLHILLALADAEDVATRRAAGGAIAGATEFPDAVSAVLKREGGVQMLMGMCGDEDEGCVHRGVVCTRNLACCEGMPGDEARTALVNAGAVAVLGTVVKNSRNAAIVETAVEALKPLLAVEKA